MVAHAPAVEVQIADAKRGGIQRRPLHRLGQTEWLEKKARRGQVQFRAIRVQRRVIAVADPLGMLITGVELAHRPLGQAAPARCPAVPTPHAQLPVAQPTRAKGLAAVNDAGGVAARNFA